MKRTAILSALTVTIAVPPASAQDDVDVDVDADVDDAFFEEASGSELSLHGYVDLGFAHVQGNGTSYLPGDTRIPADYVVDTFATSINSRGDVAGTEAGRFTNGFLPRSMGIGGRPSAFVNQVTQDLRYDAIHERLMVFARAHFLPRLQEDGDTTRLLIEQAFARIIPFDSLELAISVGRFDSVFGIEYLDNQSNLRTGITPSGIARYTTGQGLGAKIFYRFHIPSLWSSISFNVAATNGGAQVEALQPISLSMTGVPVLSGRLGYELNLPRLQIKLGASGLHGPRNDQFDPDVKQTMMGFDARLYIAGFSLSGEWISFAQDPGNGPKVTGAGRHMFPSGFEVDGYWVQGGYRLPLELPAAFTVYARLGRRHAWFDGFPWLVTRRLTAGLRVDVAGTLALKGEWIMNMEAAHAPPVDNDVLAASAVWSW